MKILVLLILCLTLSGIKNAEATGFSLYRQRDQGHLRSNHLADMPQNDLYFKIGQGFSLARLLDQRMSNLHYTGPGAVLSFSRYSEGDRYRSELDFAGIRYQVLQPRHEGTTVNNPSAGIRYAHLRRLNVRSVADYHAGGQVEVAANVRLAPALSNSFLYADFTGTLQPRFDMAYILDLFDREFQFDLTLALGILGYGIRIPEYGVSYQLGSSGSEVLTNHVQTWLHPGNYRHVTTGIYYNNRMGRMDNPNRFRIGYKWDYTRISGRHGLSLHDASHQLVLELLFLVN